MDFLRTANAPARFCSQAAAPFATAYHGCMLWEKDGTSIEIRTKGALHDGSPALDEIVASGAFIHLEQMDHDAWWMGIEAGGKHFHLNVTLRDGQLHVHLSDQGDEHTEWEGDSRPRLLPGEDGQA